MREGEGARGPLASLVRLARPQSGAAPTSAEGRSVERYRRSLLASAMGVVSRLATVVTLLVGTAVLSRSLGSEALGAWLLLVTAISLVGFADLGVGSAVLNLVSSAHGRDDVDDARRTVASALGILGALGLAIAIAVPVLAPLVPWSDVLGAQGVPEADLDAAVIAFGLVVAFSLPASVSMRVRFAYQEGWIANAWTTAGTVASLVAVVALASQPLWVVTTAMLIGVPLAHALDVVVLMARSRPELRPQRRDLDRSTAQLVLRSGFLFFVLGAAVAIGYQSDALIISNRLGSDVVADYAVAARLFLLGPTAVQLLVMPLWPAYAEALARLDVRWVRSTLRRSIALGAAITVVPSLVLLVVAGPLISWLSDGQAHPSTGLLVALACWALLTGVSAPLAVFLNGAHILRPQLVAATAMTVTNVALSLALVSKLGVSGPVIGSIVTQTLCILVPFAVLLRPVLGRSSTDADLARWVRRWSGDPERTLGQGPVGADQPFEATIE